MGRHKKAKKSEEWYLCLHCDKFVGSRSDTLEHVATEHRAREECLYVCGVGWE